MGKQLHPLSAAMALMSWRHEHAERAAKFAGLTKHIKDPSDRRKVECLCEQQLKHLSEMDEATQTSDVAIFQKFAFKIIPRVYPKLFVKSLVSVQPIPVPNAKVFYKDFYRDPSGTPLHKLANFDRTYANRGAELSPVPKINMKITDADVIAESKALQYEFSVELNQDLMAYHGLSADPELGAEAAAEIQREIDSEIINTMFTEAAAGNVNWSAVPPVVDNKTIDIEAYNKTLYHAIVDARTLIYKERYVFPTFIIGGPDFGARLEKLSGFEYDPSFDPAQITAGRQFFGTLRKVMDVYIDPWIPDPNKAVVGYKGASDFDVGLVYAPYVPFYSTAPFENPGTLGISRAILSRQAIAMLVPEMYATITITDVS